jgi:flavin-dependent dehydrogenase
VFNVGIYVTDSHRAGKDGRHRMQDINLRDAFKRFSEFHAPLRELLAGGQWVGELKGAPVRCSLEGATPSRAGLMVIGEAVGTTYLLSGEGIGKALETGILAGEAILAGGNAPDADAAVRSRYEQALSALQPHYEAYTRGNLANHRPWLVDLLVWSTRDSPRRRDKLAAVLDERYTPRRLMGAGSWWRLLSGQS